MLTSIDAVADKWWLYRVGQELGTCKRVQGLFRRFVRTFVLGLDNVSINGATQTSSAAASLRAVAH